MLLEFLLNLKLLLWHFLVIHLHHLDVLVLKVPNQVEFLRLLRLRQLRRLLIHLHHRVLLRYLHYLYHLVHRHFLLRRIRQVP
jgi:hypothetical protein